MLHHLVQDLIDEGVNADRIIMITVETPIYNGIGLEQLFKLAMMASGNSEIKNRYVIFDEVQYLKEWEIHLKSLVDSYRDCKFIASGSAAAALKYKSMESGAGRFTDFLLPPLTFDEFIDLTGKDHLMKPVSKSGNDQNVSLFTTPHIAELNKHFLDYINFGGYPEAIFSENIKSDPGRFIRHDIVDKVLLRDLPGLYGIRDVQELNSLFTTIAYNTGNEFSLEELAKSSGVNKQTIRTYIEYLQSAFLIKIVRRIDQSGKKFRRDNFFKIYLTNPSLRGALFSPVTATDKVMGRMVETTIFAQWMHTESFIPWYARWQKGEVDLVALNHEEKPRWALEIKWTNRFFDYPKDLKSILRFSRDNNLTNVTVTTIDIEGNKLVDGVMIHFIPCATYSFTIGRNIFNGKMEEIFNSF